MGVGTQASSCVSRVNSTASIRSSACPTTGARACACRSTRPALLRFEGGASSLDARLHALRRLARDGYPVGLTVAPIQPFEGWREGYADLFARTARALEGAADLDLTAEFITHRFTPKSKGVLQGWYPGSDLDHDEAKRSRKLTKFGSTKFVYPAPLMRELRDGIPALLRERLPQARALYWT